MLNPFNSDHPIYEIARKQEEHEERLRAIENSLDEIVNILKEMK